MSVEEQDSLMSSLRGQRCWVAGCGFLGACLLTACRSVGMEALGLDREPWADIQGDAADPAVLLAAREAMEPELIFCCVATHGGDMAAYRAAYHEVPRALHAACPSARLLFCSSSSVYGGQGGEVVAEDAPCRNHSAKARLLLSAEGAVLAMGGMVARLAPLYGASRCELLRRFVQREPELAGEAGRMLNYIHRMDAARGLLHLAAAFLAGNGPPVVNVCAESFSRGEVYGSLARLTGIPRGKAVAEGGRRGVSNQQVSSALLRSLGWVPQVHFMDWAATHWQKWC